MPALFHPGWGVYADTGIIWNNVYHFPLTVVIYNVHTSRTITVHFTVARRHFAELHDNFKAFEQTQNSFCLHNHLNFRLCPDKCLLFPSCVRWYELLHSEDLWRYDPHNYSVLCYMAAPSTGAPLQQFFCVLN